MRVPLSWLRDYVEIDVPTEVLAERLTVAGMEVAHIEYLGLPQTEIPGIYWPKSEHLVWDREKIVLGAIHEVKPHPNADRLVLALVDYGGPDLEQVVTGAPNLFAYRESGRLPQPLWTALALEGAEVWDGHSEVPKRMILKEKALRGIPNRSMVCSEMELGLGDSHEGIILLHEQPRNTVTGELAAPGTPLQDVLGDIVFEIELTPNLARAYSVLGIAREVAALLDKPLRQPGYDVIAEGAPIEGTVSLEILDPELNPRFTLHLLRAVTVRPSPEWAQRRLRLAGSRPINNIVDVTNYITLEIGQPLHAYDYDKLVARNGGKPPIITTRLPEAGETLETIDHMKRVLEPHNILVTDEAGVLGLGGVIGGAETEISDDTTTVLLEAAAWNFINIRRTTQSQKVFTDASTRYSRGVHPSQALLGGKRGVELMRQFSGGTVARGAIDAYPSPAPEVRVTLRESEIDRLLGVRYEAATAAALLRRLGFTVTVNGSTLDVIVPDHRMDISADPVTGQADLIEEIARIHGYDKIPDTLIDAELPEQLAKPGIEWEERARDVLAALGLRENVSYRLTSPEREAQLHAPSATNGNGTAGYVRLANPITSDKTVLRQTLLVNLLENARANQRYHARQWVFEIGNVYYDRENQLLPDEPRHVGLLMTGPREVATWDTAASASTDYFDIKGVVEGLVAGLHIEGRVSYQRAEHPSYHPGRSAQLIIDGEAVGTFGELHPLVAQNFELTSAPVMAAEFDLDALLNHIAPLYGVRALPVTPPVLQDIALVVREATTNAQVEAVIWKAGGDLLKGVRLFDVYRGENIPAGHKSLAYNLTYQTDERTLTDKEVAKVHEKIVRATERELDATLRA